MEKVGAKKKIQNLTVPIWKPVSFLMFCIQTYGFTMSCIYFVAAYTSTIKKKILK